MADNPFPLQVVLPKVNSPELLAYLQQFGADKYWTAEEINLVFQALEFLYENIGSGTGPINPSIDNVLENGNITERSVIFYAPGQINGDGLIYVGIVGDYLVCSNGVNEMVINGSEISFKNIFPGTEWEKVLKPNIAGNKLQFDSQNLATESFVAGQITNKADLVGGKVPQAQSQPSNLSYNSSSGVITLTDATGQTYQIDLPIENLFQNASYNSSNQTLSLTTNGGGTIAVSLASLVDLPEIVVSASSNPATTPSTGQRLYLRADNGSYWIANSGAWFGPFLGVSATEKNTWNAKQDSFSIIDFSLLSTITGFSSVSLCQIFVVQCGRFDIVSYTIQGTSNATTLTFTVPNNNHSVKASFGTLRVQNNSSYSNNAGYAQVSPGSNVVTCFTSLTGGTFTASGTKTVIGTLIIMRD